MANNRELSQLASFVTVDDTTKTIALGSTIAGLNVVGVSTISSLGVGTIRGDVSIGGTVTIARGLSIGGGINDGTPDQGLFIYPSGELVSEGTVTVIAGGGGGGPDCVIGVNTLPTGRVFQGKRSDTNTVTTEIKANGDISIGGTATIDGDLLVDAGTVTPIRLDKGGGGVGINTFNTAIGYQVLQNATLGGAHNTGLGYRALQNVTSSEQNTGMGVSALSGISSGVAYQNTAIGYGALNKMESSIYSRGHTAVGANALSSLVTPDGVGITAIGQAAGRGLTTGQQNTIVGYGAYTYAKSGSGNVVIGNSAADGTAVGGGKTLSNSVAIGYRAMTAAGIGTTCTAVGMDSLYGGSYQNATGLGAFAAVTGDNQVQLGNAATTVYAYGSVQDRSDSRDKADIRDTTLGLSFIGGLRPVDFKWDYREDYASVEEYAAMTPAEQETHWAGTNKDGSRKRSRYHHGLIAQEVKATADAQGVEFGGYQDHSVNGGNSVLSIGYNELIGPMIKAIQELKARVEALEGG